MNTNRINTPTKVLSGILNTSVGKDYWPYDDGDEYWSGGINPRFYTFTVSLTINAQTHSSPNTRQPYVYNGLDINSNMWIADQASGIALKITSIISKSENNVICVVEDYLRYNTLRYTGGTGNGIFGESSSIIVFSLNEDNLPLIDPVPSSISPVFYSNLMSRFSFTAKNYYFELYKIGHDFQLGDLISADSLGHTFQKTSSDYPHVIGEVVYTSNGSSVFMIDPLQQINEELNYIIGDVGDVLYANAIDAGQLSLSGNLPVMIKIRNNTNSSVIATGGVSTDPSSIIKVNNVITSVGSGSAQDFVDNVNANTSVHGVIGSLIPSPTVVSSDSAQFAQGEPALYITGTPPVASINGVNVTFTTTTVGQASYGDTYALEEDMATDINAANIPDIVASFSTNRLTLTNTAGGAINIVNITPDGSGYNFAGPMSASGIPLSTSANTGEGMIRLDAIDARAINVIDEFGTGTEDFGLYSAENGQKAAAISVEQGLRTSSSYVVSSIAARDGLSAIFGDTCFVSDKGNGEWGYYLYTLDSQWIKVSDEDSAATDSQSISITVNFDSASELPIHTVSSGSRVTFVTVDVIDAFDNGASLTVGDIDDNARLMPAEQNDLSVISSYSSTPSFIYTGGSDVGIVCYFNGEGVTTGQAIVTISYQ